MPVRPPHTRQRDDSQQSDDRTGIYHPSNDRTQIHHPSNDRTQIHHPSDDRTWSSTSRRRLLIGGATVLAAGAGCLDDANAPAPDAEDAPAPDDGTDRPPAVGTEPDESAGNGGFSPHEPAARDPPPLPEGPRTPPEKPTEIDRASVVDYVEAFDGAYRENEAHNPDVTAVEAYPSVEGLRETDHGWYGHVETNGYQEESRDGEPTLHADWPHFGAAYAVGEAFVSRVDLEKTTERHPVDVETLGAEVDDAEASVTVINHDTEAHTITVELLARDVTGIADGEHLRQTITVDSATSWRVPDLTRASGEYAFRAATDRGAGDSTTVSVPRVDSPSDRTERYVVVAATGEVSISASPAG